MNNIITIKELKSNLEKHNLNESFENFLNDYYVNEIDEKDIFELQYLNINKDKYNYFYYNKYDIIEGVNQELEQQIYKKHNIDISNQNELENFVNKQFWKSYQKAYDDVIKHINEYNHNFKNIKDTITFNYLIDNKLFENKKFKILDYERKLIDDFLNKENKNISIDNFIKTKQKER